MKAQEPEKLFFYFFRIGGGGVNAYLGMGVSQHRRVWLTPKIIKISTKTTRVLMGGKQNRDKK